VGDVALALLDAGAGVNPNDVTTKDSPSTFQHLLHYLPMVEPERDDKAEQAARNEENKQETAQLLKLQRQKLLTPLLAPSNVLGLLSLYVGFVGTVVAFGVLAFYTGHKITQEIVFFTCVIFFLILPIGAIWYLRPIFTKKDALGKRLLDKLKQSSISRSLARLGNDRRVRLFNLAFYTFMICIEIRQFPLHPRFSLAMVVLYMALSFASLIFWVSETLEVEILNRLRDIVDVLERVWEMANYARGIAESSLKFIEGTEKSHSEAHETTTVALRAVNDAVQELARFVTKPAQVESEDKEPTDR
jgi:hypothetical protein